MELKDIDIVYFVKEAETNEELRYSLRSVDKNFPHRKVWIYGGLPAGIYPDKHVCIAQTGKTKWDRVQNMFRQVCLNNDITENFVLFNDDFFAMKPVTNLKPYCRGTIYEHIIKLERAFGDKPTEYSLQLRNAAKAMEDAGITCYSYELHLPMIFNRHKLLEVMGAFPDTHCTRTLYGNYCGLGGETIDDVKVYNTRQEFDKDGTFLSTQDSVFSDGTEVFKHICDTFPQKSRFEKISLSRKGVL